MYPHVLTCTHMYSQSTSRFRLTFSGSACPAREPHLAGCVDTADLILHCGAGQLQAHKHKLAAVSGVFATMIKDNSQAGLDHNNNNNNNDKNANILAGTKDRIVVQGVELEILRKILAFIYTGDTKDFAAHCVKLLKAAHLYQVRTNYCARSAELIKYDTQFFRLSASRLSVRTCWRRSCPRRRSPPSSLWRTWPAANSSSSQLSSIVFSTRNISTR